ncbi:DTW domain-containing protein [Vibrio sp. S9_S30]|uniref:tRNA-uridine aminocarboxypropyltransferase n=1 Tax=Vibrio sp. S9_S30 TaxID=2720226 RepID=UPI001680F82A|nr:tRNA-uridine aminocarboxypropyltransferase [Vibrio sp. S9_S30]MBD1558004.1 DTW domain-containing protein [Vibrio sp. S9_S30]
MSDHQSASTYRYCQHCGKAKKMCICHTIQNLHSEVELIILQHPDEVHRAMGTARILNLSLDSCRILVGENFTENAELNTLLQDDSYIHWVLFPNEKSVPVTQLSSAHLGNTLGSRSEMKKIRVLLIDGTWKKAYKIWRLSENLHCLLSVALPDSLKGNYRIRKAPSSNSLSTVEAGFHLLNILEPSQDFTPLIESFNQMVDRQFKHIPSHIRTQNY